MASSFSDLLRLEYMATGEKTNQWGSITSDNLDKLEEAIAGTKSITLASSDVTLSTTNGGGGAGEQAAAMVLDCSGVLSADVVILAQNASKVYIVKNDTSGAFTVSINTLTGTIPLVIPQGETYVVICDPSADSAKGTFYTINALVSGTVALATNAEQLGGVVAAGYAQLAVKNTWTLPQIVLKTDMTLSAGIYTPNANEDANLYLAQADADANITIANPTGTPVAGQVMTFHLEQHASTLRSLTWGSKFIFTDDVNQNLTQTLDAVDVFTAQYNANLDRWLVAGVAQNYPRA